MRSPNPMPEIKLFAVLYPTETVADARSAGRADWFTREGAESDLRRLRRTSTPRRSDRPRIVEHTRERGRWDPPVGRPVPS